MTRANPTTGLLPNPPTGGILQQLQHFLKEQDQPAYRYQQLVLALQHGAVQFEEIRAIPKPLREGLTAAFGSTPLPLDLVEAHRSGQAQKVLFRTRSGARIETVLSQYREGWTSMCISSQAGCGLGCTFCATAAMGLVKNLTADEICAQVFHRHWQQRLPDSIAFMGMGEALANPNIFTAIEALITKGYGGMSQRRLTVSTVGFAPNLEVLLHRYPQVNITLSVHSPFPEQRAALIPLEKRFPLQDNLAILDRYVQRHKRKVYLAYLLIDGLNDTAAHLETLVALVKAQYRPGLCHLSVIRYNAAFGADPDYHAPAMDKITFFVEQLNKAGVNATKRTQFGAGIEAACGQLHADYMQRHKAGKG